MTGILMLSFAGIHAQNNTVTSGGDATGSNGKINYTVGQTNFISETGSNGNVTQGVQQPYEITVVLGINNKDINLTSSIYPNPASSYVTLNFNNDDPKNISYLLYDSSGKLYQQKKVNGKQTLISMTDLADGVYFIKVLDNKSELKLFKIIKTN